jgi:phosphoglycolate phosphatase
MENGMKAVVFDLDGTLIDSAPDIRAAANKMLAGEGMPPLELATVTSFIGNGLPKLVERAMRHVALPMARHEDLTATTLAIYNDSPSDLTRPYDGVIPCLERLRSDGYRLAICTNKPFEIAQNVVSELGMSFYFEAVVGADTLPVRKPDPAPLKHCLEVLEASTALYVGDSEIDYQTAQNARIAFALFTGGYQKEELCYFKYETLFNNFKELKGISDKQFDWPTLL